MFKKLFDEDEVSCLPSRTFGKLALVAATLSARAPSRGWLLAWTEILRFGQARIKKIAALPTAVRVLLE